MPALERSTVELEQENGEPVGKELSVRKEGTLLYVPLSSGQELRTATLEIQATSAERELTGVTFLTDAGPVKDPWSSNKTVAWVTAEWGQALPLVKVNLDADSENVKARLKIRTETGWSSPYPFDTIAAGSEQRFPPILASGIMLELLAKSLEPPGTFVPSPAQVKGLTFKVTSQPSDISFSVGEEAPFFKHPGILLSARSTSVEGLAQAVNHYLADPQHQSPVPLWVRATVLGKIQVPKFKPTVVEVVRHLEDFGRKAVLPIPWNGEAVGRVKGTTGSSISAIGFSLETELQAQRLYLDSPEPSPGLAHLCDPTHTAAQGFEALPADQSLVGLDLYLRPGPKGFVGTLKLYPDQNRRPASQPFAGLEVSIALPPPEAGPSRPRWVMADFSMPLPFSAGPWWAVLSVSNGSAAWLLGNGQPEGASGAAYRVGEGPWFARRNPSDQGPVWSYTRLRVVDPSPKGSSVSLRRGDSVLEAVVDPDGRVSISDETTLERLNPPNPAPTSDVLEILIAGESAGTATLSELRVVLDPNPESA